MLWNAGPTRRVVSGISVGDNLLLSPLGRRYGDCRSDVPALETLMIVDGTLERPVRHIRVEGITFAHTSWMRPSYQGHVTLQGGFPLLDAYKLHEPGLPEKAELENQAWIARPETAIRVRGTSILRSVAAGSGIWHLRTGL